VQVDDLSDALARAQRLGGSAALPPTPLPRGGRFAVIHDVEGNELGLLER
jgi:predicted enzyme related to lactoylglutathione lyase